MRWRLLIPFLAGLGACSRGGTETVPVEITQPDVFTGTWRSTVSSAEFVRFSVQSLSREAGLLGARLTFSGVYWEGTGRIDGDSLVTQMAFAGNASQSARLVARVADGGVLRIQLQQESMSPLTLTFVRDQ